MAVLRRTLYWQALVWAVSGLSLASFPKVVLVGLFSQVHYPEYAWIRLAGLEAIALAMFMVLVAHRIEELWWWSWGFTIPTAFMFLLVTLNAAFGLPGGSSPILWWILSAVSLVFSAALVYGLLRAGRERPVV